MQISSLTITITIYPDQSTSNQIKLFVKANNCSLALKSCKIQWVPLYNHQAYSPSETFTCTVNNNIFFSFIFSVTKHLIRKKLKTKTIQQLGCLSHIHSSSTSPHTSPLPQLACIIVGWSLERQNGDNWLTCNAAFEREKEIKIKRRDWLIDIVG